MPNLRILIAGNWNSPIHEEPLCRAFSQAGCHTTKFKWHPYLDAECEKGIFKKICVKIELRISRGRTISRINDGLISAVREFMPDILFIYRPQLISGATISRIKEGNSKLIICCYNNDDPFSEEYPFYYWKVFLSSISLYDIVFAYRPKNIPEYYELGAKKVVLSPPWYDSTITYPAPSFNSDGERIYSHDVVFIGHYENDGRVEYIKSLVREGLDVGLYGPEWNKKIKNDPILKRFYPVRYLNIEECNRVLCASKMALVIYSKFNNDVYTRRCFEIPATGTMMIAKRTNDMMRLFQEEEEIIYFDKIEELIKKSKYYSNNIDICKKVGINGMRRAIDSGYDVNSRASKLIDEIENIKNVNMSQNQ